MFKGKINYGETVIGDNNYLDYMPSPVTHPEGYGLVPRNFGANPLGSIAPMASFKMLTWPEIIDRAEYNEENKCRTSDILRRRKFFTSNQGRTNFCWMHGWVNGMKATAIIQNIPLPDLSAASAAAPCKNFQNSGGWGGESGEWLTKYGVATMQHYPANEISRSLYTQSVKDNALLHRIEEWEDLDSKDMQAICSAMVQNILCPVAFNWWRHLLLGVDPIITGPRSADMRLLNSHNDADFIVLTGSRAIPDDTQCIKRINSFPI